MATMLCLYCKCPINPRSLLLEGQMITCPNCDTQLEVINLDPLELDWVFLEPAVGRRGMGLGRSGDWENEEAAP